MKILLVGVLMLAGCGLQPPDPYAQYQLDRTQDRLAAQMERTEAYGERAAERAGNAAPVYCFDTDYTTSCR
jgi:hypothetical protein